jgi:hypothetical protein
MIGNWLHRIERARLYQTVLFMNECPEHGVVHWVTARKTRRK